jgi:hypothetical protein
LILTALFINGAAGWRSTSLGIAPGQNTTLSQGDGLQIHVDAITGGQSDAASAITVAQADGATRQGQASYGRPLWLGNLWIAQRATGSALAVRAQGADGQPVVLQSQTGDESLETLHVLFSQSESEQTFASPTRNLTMRVVNYPSLPERGVETPVFLIEAYRGDDPSTPILEQLVEEEGMLLWAETVFHLRRERHTVLEVAYLPGLLPLWLGAALLVAGVAITLWRGQSAAWIRLAPEQGAVRARVSLQAAQPGQAEWDRVAEAVSPGEPADAN